MTVNRGLLKHIIFWVFYITAFWGSFEQAYNSPGHPIWSSTWNTPIPIPHHYVVGFLGIAVAYILFTLDDWTLQEEIEEELEKFKAELLGRIMPYGQTADK